jgi:hypothetical protein
MNRFTFISTSTNWTARRPLPIGPALKTSVSWAAAGEFRADGHREFVADPQPAHPTAHATHSGTRTRGCPLAGSRQLALA